jgi:hypothetical protein
MIIDDVKMKKPYMLFLGGLFFQTDLAVVSQSSCG